MGSQNFSYDTINVDKISTEYRQIDGRIPAVGTSQLLQRLSTVESRSMHGQLPIIWSSASDFSVTDIANNKFLDFTSSIFIANVGHSNQAVNEAIKNTMTNSLYSCYSYANHKRIEYLEKLIDFAGEPFEKAFKKHLLLFKVRFKRRFKGF